ncbi:MAG: chemotaxis protein CheW [Bacteroidia bacterium]|nr:chemotaxis protein CheW [Bacteroidia bacterium]
MMDFGDYFCFGIEGIQLGIPLYTIDRVIRSVAVNQLPNSPPIVHGLIDYYGTIVPVINLRHRLTLNEKPISPNQLFLIVNTTARKLALVVDSADGVISFSDNELISSGQLNSGIEASGVYRTEDGILLIYDPEKFLTSEEVVQIDRSIQSEQIRQISNAPSETA